MSLPIHDAHSGYKANELPSHFQLDEDIFEIGAVLDQWYEPSARYFKVQTTEQKTYLLRYDNSRTKGSYGARRKLYLLRPSRAIQIFVAFEILPGNMWDLYPVTPNKFRKN